MTDETLRVLIASANQVGSPLATDVEVSEIERVFESSALGERLVVRFLPATRADDLVKQLRRLHPQIVHFIGHGTTEGIELRYGDNDVQFAPGPKLRELFEDRGVELVVLNSCYSAEQAAEIAAVVPMVIGVPNRLEDDAGRRFSAAFYDAIGRGELVSDAFRDGKDAVSLHGRKGDFMLMASADRAIEPSAAAGESGWPAPVQALLLAIAALLAIAGLLVLASGGDPQSLGSDLLRV